MSRFADLANTKLVVIGECQCPGTPHARDEAQVHRELGYSARGKIGAAAALSFGDFTAARRKLVELGVESWNLLGPDGKPWPPTEENIELLDEATIDAIAEGINAAVEPTPPLPNASDAPSPDGSPGSVSPTPEGPTPPSSTTS